MADDSLETQLRRLAALVTPLAETVNQHDARLAQHEVHMARLDAIIERLDRLLVRLIERSDNGREA